ncbi:MAG: PD-(D/E)XK nuclease family protein, partial [Flavobacteriaceae bacterium]|nr:PD-(D/E)XK nuclease family protein [Flavobacteriaceae bacterium]
NDLLDKDYDLSKVHLILPGRRPVVFFKKYFIDKGYDGFMPVFSTIEDFVLRYSGLVKIENIPLWFEAFQIQKKYINPQEKLEDFLKWIPTLLKDFNDIDTFAENPLKVLEHLASIERIENWGETLDSRNNEKLFYKNSKFWKNNLVLYKELTASLKKKGTGTQGMILSSVMDNLNNINIPEDEIFAFVGLNAITPKEEKLIKHFISHSQTLLYWDSDVYYMKDKNQEAGHFLRSHSKWGYYANRDFQWVENSFSQPKKINVVSTSQEVAQAKYVGTILKNLTEEELQQTALVLCDETILPSIMESLPESVKRINITMGYPLKNSLLASFFKQVFQLHIFREKNKSGGFYFQDVLDILQNSLIGYVPSVSAFITDIKNNNRVFIPDALIYERLNSWEMLFVFESYRNPLELIQKLYKFCANKFWEPDHEEPILRENYLKFKNLFSLLFSQLSQDASSIDSFSLLYTFYQHILINEKIDFIGEPLEGLQLMGMLETRLLSFKNIIMTGVNEGILPAGKSDNSFIPFDVKKNYDINTFLENDAIYAYHFYRLLQHAENITLLYNNFTEGINSGEKSRFISQLEFESDHKINEIVASYSGDLERSGEFSIEKTPALVEAIHQWLKKPVSPTHLTSYQYNPVGFYLQKILRLGGKKEIEEEISPLSYGNLIHHTLESLYSQLKGNILTENDLKVALSNYPIHLEDYIKKELNPDLFERGQNYLQKLLAEKTVEKIILRDLADIKNGNVIFLKDIEKKLTSTVDIQGIGIVQLKGFVDRWDIFNGQNRIIDYKTSSVSSLKFKSEKLNNIREDKNFKFFIQLVFYAYMILNEKLAEPVQVGIWSFKKPFRGLELLHFDGVNLFSESQVSELFEEVIKMIREIANPEIPFVEKI